MKKLINVILLVVLCFSLVGCGKEPKEVQLTKDNFEKYIILDVQLSDYNVEKKNTLIGQDHKGTATLTVTARLRKNVNAEGIIINGAISIVPTSWSAFSENPVFKLVLDKDGYAEYTKKISTEWITTFVAMEEPRIGTNTKWTESINSKENAFVYEGLLLWVEGNIYD